MTAAPSTAAIILIGNELLSGKIRDENAFWLTGRLRALGVSLRRVVVVPDEEGPIVEEVRRCSSEFTHVFTSGGVGPTHDDVTLPCIAVAFGVDLVVDPELERGLRQHLGDRLTPGHLRMAAVPRGMTLIHGGAYLWPVMRIRNVVVLPGVPQIFRAKFDAIAEQFRGERFFLVSVDLDADEGSIAACLEAVEREHGVSVGSYPRIDREADYRVRVTVESRERAAVDTAVQRLLDTLPASARVVRVESPAE